MSQVIHYKPLSKDLIWLSELTIGNTQKKRLEIAIVKLHQVFFKAIKGDKQAQALVEEWEGKIKETYDYFTVLHKQYEEKIKEEIGEVTYEPYDKVLSWSVNCTLVGDFVRCLLLYDRLGNTINLLFMFSTDSLSSKKKLTKNITSLLEITRAKI